MLALYFLTLFKEAWYSGHIPECKVYVRNERKPVHNTTPFVWVLWHVALSTMAQGFDPNDICDVKLAGSSLLAERADCRHLET